MDPSNEFAISDPPMRFAIPIVVKMRSTTSEFFLLLVDRAGNHLPLTLDRLKTKVYKNHFLSERFEITKLIYKKPVRSPNGVLRFFQFPLVDDDSVRTMVSIAQSFGNEVPHAELALRGRVVVDPLDPSLTPFSMDRRLTAIHHNGRIVMEGDGVHFYCPSVKLCRLRISTTFEDMKRKIERKCGPQRHGLAAVYFRCPAEDALGRICWTQNEIRTDGDVEQMFNTNSQYHSLSPVELYAEFRRTSEEVLALLREDPELSRVDNNCHVNLGEF